MKRTPLRASSRRKAACSFFLLMLSSALLAFPARGQGFGVFEQGTCTMGRAGATVAQPCNDGSTLFFNPAGLTATTDFTLSGGATLIIAQGNFTDDRTRESTDLENDPIPVPHAYLTYASEEKWAAGLGVFVPYGLGTTWPTEDFEGRFLGYDNNLQSIYIQPTAAYEVIEGLSVGAGLDIVFGSVELNQRLDLSAQQVPDRSFTFAQLGIPPGTDFADASLEGSGTGIGGNFGVQYEATDWLRLGVRYMTAVPLDYEGDARFEQVETGITLPEGNPFGQDSPEDEDDLAEPVPLDAVVADQFQEGGLLTDQSVETEITMPAQLVAGVSVQPMPMLTLLADYQWMGWSSFDTIPLDFENDPLDQEQIENYEDTHALRLGGEYALNDMLTLRAGYLTHGAAAPDETVTPLLPEAYRNEYTIGLGVQLASGWGFNAAYQYIDQNDRRGRVTELPEGEFEVSEVNSGLYSFQAHLIGATLTLQF